MEAVVKKEESIWLKRFMKEMSRFKAGSERVRVMDDKNGE